ncbi:MAG: zinc-ribbon domain-containing protein [Desulfobacterales bacterium]|nr:zinc-ribbon domain-containing protein [Desulfobacterales bacterium]
MKPNKADRRRIRLRKRAIEHLPRFKTKHRFVDHTRYGDQPILSRENFSMEEVRASFWGYSRIHYIQQIIFPETAIRADVMKQNAGCSPRRLYVDIARPCRSCGRWFIFYALEQKFWYEILGFFVDSDCLHCQECRHVEHELKNGIDRYGLLLSKDAKTDAEWQELSDLADFLHAQGYIKKAETLLKSRRPKRMTR